MWHALVTVFALAGVIAGGVATISWRRRHRAPALRIVAAWAASITWWSASVTGMLVARSEAQVFVATTATFIGIGATMTAFFCLCLATVDRAWRLTPAVAAALAVEPALVVLALLTGRWHQLFVRAFVPGLQGTLVPDFGPLFWVHVIYVYAVLAGGIARVVRAWWAAGPGHRWVYAWAPLSTIPPMVANLVGLSLAGRTVDLTVVGFAITVIVAYLTVVRRSLPELVPVARRRVLDTIGDAVTVIDSEGRIIDVNPAAERLLRRLYTGLEPPLIGVVPEPLETDNVTFPDRGESDHVLVDANHTGIDLHVRVQALLDHRRRIIGWVLVARDVTESNRQRRDLEQANVRLHEQLRTIDRLRADLAEQAVRDALTGLYNRRHLLDTLDRELRKAARSGAPLSLALIDIDHFKQVNDQHGHAVGDAVLVQVGRMLSEEVRSSDVVARYGGEEFVVVLPGTSRDHAYRRLDDLRAQVGSADLRAGARALAVTISAGVASAAGPGDPAALIAAADEALYLAKRRGRNRVEPVPVLPSRRTPGPARQAEAG